MGVDRAEYVDTVVIGAGQAGLAMSRCLTERGVEHVVLERGRVGERWRTERWASLTLLTPRWLSRLSDWASPDPGDPQGYMDGPEVVRYLDAFAASFTAPVRTGVTVRSVRAREPGRTGYRVETDRGGWLADHVVIATGPSQHAQVPSFAADLEREAHQVVPTKYRRPDDLPDGGVLVVGASSTGVQLAAELQASGRPVTLAVGRHTRLPRTYRDRDILAWFHAMGILDERASAVYDLDASRNQPSMQLTGSRDGRSIDLGILKGMGVRLTGRALGARGGRVHFDDDLIETVAAADLKLAGLRLRIDRFIEGHSLAAEVGPQDPFVPIEVESSPSHIDLKREGIRTVLWATGFGRSYPWLHVPALDRNGEVRHVDGITTAPGLYVLGLNFLRTRASSFIFGAARDAEAVARHLTARRASQRTHGPSARAQAAAVA